MMRDDFKPGDIVASIVCGFYKGVPGRIDKLAPVQFGGSRRFIITLAETGKRITLAAKYIERCKDKPQ